MPMVLLILIQGPSEADPEERDLRDWRNVPRDFHQRSGQTPAEVYS